MTPKSKELMKELSLSAEIRSLSSPTEESLKHIQEPSSHPLQLISEGLLERILVGWFLILYGLILIRNAWLSDDSYITLRVVDNFVDGYGLRYNIDERVQAFTHPLWMFLLSAVYAITRDGYLSLLCLCLVASMLAVSCVAFRLAATPLSALLALLCLILSQSFMDFSTSGLENSLSHLLAAAILLTFLRREVRFRTVLLMAFLVCLATLNRMDTLLLFLPMLAVWVWRYGLIRGIPTAALGFLPFAAWEAFSILYYGFPFPNTAYAKLGADVGAGQLFLSGLFYLLDSIESDPLTPLVIFLGILIPFLVGTRNHLPVIAGVALYLIYLLRIGGDFMSGRFLSTPFLLMVALISTYPFTTSLRTWPLPFVVALIMGLSAPHPTLALPPGRATLKEADLGPSGYISPHGIANERLYYFYKSGLINVNPDFAIEGEGGPLRGNDRSKVQVIKCAGFYGFTCSRETHLIDTWALVDPLLARLPSIRADRGEGRTGHFERTVPEGYYETLANGEDHFSDRSLAEYYKVLCKLTRDDLFSPGRFRAIWDMNRGRYNHLIDMRRYLNPGMDRYPLDSVSTILPEGLSLEDPSLTKVGEKGLQVDLGEIRKSSEIEISLDPFTTYDLYFSADSIETGHVRIPSSPEKTALALHEIQAPTMAVKNGFKVIRFLPENQSPKSVLGHIRLLE
jgi:arabinofuranosyltransferase